MNGLIDLNALQTSNELRGQRPTHKNHERQKQARAAKKIRKCFRLLSQNPRHPGLNSHPILGSEESVGVKIWTSFVQNKMPAAHRILWSYSQTQREIIILQMIPHY